MLHVLSLTGATPFSHVGQVEQPAIRPATPTDIPTIPHHLFFFINPPEGLAFSNHCTLHWAVRSVMKEWPCGTGKQWLHSPRAPAPVEEVLDGRKEDFVDQQPNKDDGKHDANDLIHLMKVPAEFKQLPQAKPG